MLLAIDVAKRIEKPCRKFNRQANEMPLDSGKAMDK
jgi:hypothetical protein